MVVVREDVARREVVGFEGSVSLGVVVGEVGLWFVRVDFFLFRFIDFCFSSIFIFGDYFGV